ncbi:hypothetical protein VNO77_43456 [Canavalia gladiata]|uniref:Uncharacterized protein n=1 Tax=Canavalia gladiata TaxID=3824 RepID=A0AAN9JU43_CANGL
MDGRIQAESHYFKEIYTEEVKLNCTYPDPYGVWQKQYFEQRKRQQQNLQTMGSDNCSDSPGIIGQSLKENQSLDILNFLNLSTNFQQSNPLSPKGRDDGEIGMSTMPGSASKNLPTIITHVDTTVNSCRFEEAKAGSPFCCQIEASPKKSAPDHQTTAFNGPPNHWKTVTDQYSELSVMDLLCDDEPNATVEKCPTCEDHVSFSLEGLGKVGRETPAHSPEQQARIPCSYSPLPKDGRKSKLKNLNYVLDDIELEMDIMTQDIKVSPTSSSDFPFKVKRSSAVVGDGKHFYDLTDINDSSISEEFFYKTENSNEDLWNEKIKRNVEVTVTDEENIKLKKGKNENPPPFVNPACSSFHDKKFDNPMGYDTACKKTFRMDSKSPEKLKSGAYKMESCAFEDLLPKKWYLPQLSAPSPVSHNDIFDLKDGCMYGSAEPLASFSKDELENDFDFYAASRARFDGNFNAQNLIPEDVRDNSSLLSEESSSSAAVRGESIAHLPSRTGENRRKYRNVFASHRNSGNTKDKKYKSIPNPSKRISSHYSNSILQEELDGHNRWKFEEKNASVDKSSVAASFCLDLEADFEVFRSKSRIEDPFIVFTTPELHNKGRPSFGGFKNAAPLGDSPPCSFTSEKFASDCSTAFPNVRSWPTSPRLSPDFPFKGKSEDASGFHCETSSTEMSAQGSVSKSERKVKLQKDRHKNFEQEDIFMGDNELTSEKKMAGDAPSSNNNHAHECGGAEDTDGKTTECLVTADPPGHVEISSLLKKHDKQESQADKRKSNCDAETPLECEITNEEKKIWQPEGRNTVSGKHNSEQISLSGQMMFQSYVFQLLCVQKVLKEACTT